MIHLVYGLDCQTSNGDCFIPKVTKESAIQFLALLSLANLSFMLEWRVLLYTTVEDAYFITQHSTLQYVVPIVVVVAIAGLLALFVSLGRRAKSRILCYFFFGLFGTLSLILTANFFSWVRTVVPVNTGVILGYLSDSPLMIMGVGALALLLTYFFIREFGPIIRAAKFLLLILSPFVLITFSQLAVLAGQSGTGIAAVATKPQAELAKRAPGQARAKVIWILFDELDQRILFEDRPAHFDFPSFDRLRQQSLVASRVVRPGGLTIRAIPALLSGQRVVDAKPQSSDTLLVKYKEAEAFKPFDPNNTIFGQLAQNGYRTAIAGYYHPYCRMFRGMYEACETYRSYGKRESAIVLILKSYVKLLPVFQRLSKIDALPPFFGFVATQAIRSDIDFLYAHFPIPHWPYVYDSESAAFTPFNLGLGGYFDDIALADRVLGELRHELEKAGQWDSTHILISSDHGWRESEKFDGVSDSRVPYIVKLAGQSRSVAYDGPYDVLATTELIRALLGGEITVVDELQEWMTQHEIRP